MQCVATRKGDGVADPAAVDGRSADRAKRPPQVQPRAVEDEAGSRLAADLAAALRELRGYVPQRIWWLTGAAHALLAYHALDETR
jgi:hypothetical protein